jgi:hypothetical protein
MYRMLALLLLTSASDAAQPLWPHRWVPYWQPVIEPAPDNTTTTSSQPKPPDNRLSEKEGSTELAEKGTCGEGESIDRDERQRQAVAAMREGNYAIAYHLWLPLSEQGDAEALFAIGWMYHNGYGLVIDNRKTLTLWEQAAASNHLNSLLALGLLYASGDVGVDYDPVRAAKLLMRATLAGSDEARGQLGALLERERNQLARLTGSWGDREWTAIGRSVRIAVSRANLRAGPGLDQPVVAVLAEGTILIEERRQGDWIAVAYRQKEGETSWLHRSVVEALNVATPPRADD